MDSCRVGRGFVSLLWIWPISTEKMDFVGVGNSHGYWDVMERKRKKKKGFTVDVQLVDENFVMIKARIIFWVATSKEFKEGG